MILSPLPCSAADDARPYASPEAARGDEDFALQGEYVGAGRAMQVIALVDGLFEAVIYQGGLPAGGWDGLPPRRVEIGADGLQGMLDATPMERVERRSPTLEIAPPAGAVVLFDGSEQSLRQHWRPGARRTAEGLLMEGATSKAVFQDYTLHLEFRTPFEPAARGQGRGNSGVYHQGRYETQILDSFGLEGKNNEAGGIYTVADPEVNAALPPLVWQTYDVDFTAARYDGAGNKTADARMTVRLNGTVVQRDVPVPHATRAAPVKEGPQAGPLFLQDHGDAVRFRNIWVLPRDVAGEALRPRIPAVERFYAVGDPGADRAAAGRVLIGELECTACHAAAGEAVLAKQAPTLVGIGGRVRYDHLVDWLADPQAVKPGTTMPHLLAGAPPEAAEAIASYLVGDDRVVDRRGDPEAARRGERLYHTAGCLACHPGREGEPLPEATSAPLGDLQAKYTLDALAAFLEDPHATRPSGRMPSLGLDTAEARDLACYLLQEVVLAPGTGVFQVAVYHGTWKELPDFDRMTPVRETETSDLDLSVAERSDAFGLRLETFLPVSEAGRYTFHLGSDDGSRLVVDRREVIRHDGIHPHSVRSGAVDLEPGLHRIRVDYFEASGEERLSVEVEGPQIGRSALSTLGTLDESGQPPEPLVASRRQPRSDLAERGRKWFGSLGCAACHRAGDRPSLEPPAAPALVKLRDERGCLAEQVPARLPSYRLTSRQREQIAAALSWIRGSHRPEAGDRIHLAMTAMNCYACHRRERRGGPEPQRDRHFVTTVPEMGEEGRLPPSLTGAGDKLKESYLRAVLDRGAEERPYMLTRMPAFGGDNLVGLHAALVEVDRRSEASIPEAVDPDHRVQAAGRLLAGEQGLACVKCHVFGERSTPGIQALDMQRMTTRLREDWFHRYLLDPQRYRPGTRMPASFTDGRSVKTDLYEGDPGLQIDALWRYLSGGGEAKIPAGLEGQLIELRPTQRPILYRNFLAGTSPRGIAVGYPEGIHLAWDAGRMALRRVWRGRFIDASKHWVGRGPGQQGPLGDEVMEIDEGAPLAVLDDPAVAWPEEPARERGYRFLGYRLDDAGRPTFRYAFGGTVVEDLPVPVGEPGERHALRRTLRIDPAEDAPELTLRIARAGTIEPQADRWYLVDDAWRVRVQGAGEPEIYTVDGQVELRLTLPRKAVEIVEEIAW